MMILQEEAPGRSDYSFQYSILDDDTGITHSRYVKSLLKCENHDEYVMIEFSMKCLVYSQFVCNFV